MPKKIGSLVNRLIKPLGYVVTPVHKVIPSSDEENWAEKLDIQTIIDIGSNEGQFIKDITRSLPGRKIIAFEPITSCYEKLILNTKKENIVAYNIGLSDTEGVSEINISNTTGSSSILKMKELHEVSYPDSYYVKKEQIRLERLDTVLADITLKKNILIKMDVQGYEKNVIRGGEKIFSQAAALIIESIFEPFYDDQWLFDDLHKYFTQNGFAFMGFADQANSKKSGIPLYADSIFIKRELVKRIS
jgi:FkbM family methyltransferase